MTQNPRSIADIKRVMEMVVADAANDAKNPKTFTALGVGETFGETLAMIAACAQAVVDLASSVAMLIESHGL